MNESFENRIIRLQELIRNANHIAILSGAGISTDSGIPDFRSKNGLYNNMDSEFKEYQPEYFLSLSCYLHNNKLFYKYIKKYLDCRAFEPNITHLKFAEWEKQGKRVSVITQNIDGLHEKAGSKEIYNIHGNLYKNYCPYCGKIFDGGYIFDSKEEIPECDECGGAVRPDIVLYGEHLPIATFEEATEVLHKADLMIVVGTSLSVYPAANLTADFYGENLVIINIEPTSQDQYANLVFHEPAKMVFKHLR